MDELEKGNPRVEVALQVWAMASGGQARFYHTSG